MTDPKRGIVLLACTSQDYPQRLVFPPTADPSGSTGLLASIGIAACMLELKWDFAKQANTLSQVRCSQGATSAKVPVPEGDARGVTLFSLSSRTVQAASSWHSITRLQPHTTRHGGHMTWSHGHLSTSGARSCACRNSNEPAPTTRMFAPGTLSHECRWGRRPILRLSPSPGSHRHPHHTRLKSHWWLLRIAVGRTKLTKCAGSCATT